MSMNDCIQNYINGNIRDAKRQAKRYSHKALRNQMYVAWGYNAESANTIALFLKGRASWEQACNAQYKSTLHNAH